MTAQEIAERIAFNYLREGGTLSELIERAILDGERLGQEQMREKAAQCALRHAGWARISDTQIMAANLMQEIRSIALSTPEA